MADDEKTIEVNTKDLDQLTKLLKKQAAAIRIGILGSNSARSGKSTATNAAIGAYHEFGTANLPVRSFLRMPIIDHMANRLESSKAFDEDVLKDVIKSGTTVPWLKKVGVIAETIIADAFDSGGFGKWKSSNMDRKKNAQTLVETQQLRNSVTSDIKEG